MTESPQPEEKPAENPREPDPPADGDRDGKPGESPLPNGDAEPVEDGRPEVTNAKEESLDYDNVASRELRHDFPHIQRMRDMAGRDIHHNYYGFQYEQQARGRISAAGLARAIRVHVVTASDPGLRQSLDNEPVVFLRGRVGSGRRASAVVALGRLTMPPGRVTILDAASGLGGLPDRLEKECGHLLDASDENWVDTITDAQIAGVREALRRRGGYLVILVEGGIEQSLPSTVVDHEPPDQERVAVFHLGARLVPDGTADTAGARALIAEACRGDAATERWHREITSPDAACPADAVLFAEAIWAWHERRASDPGATPRVDEFRERRRYQQATDLLRRGSGADSPLRQSYAIAAAALDGLAVSEVVEGAGDLGALLAEVEHPGEPGQRQIFAQPLARWLRHVEMTSPPAVQGKRDGTVVRMPSRELSRIVIEVAWRNYDAARTPMLDWLMGLCEQHPDDRVRIRAVQALAVIAKYDYALVKARVLEVWSISDRPVEHQAAAWLLEAMVLEGTVAEKVKKLLRRWSRSGEVRKRMVALRAYGTQVAKEMPDDAILGVRWSATDPWLSVLPELALYEMYVLGLTKQVTTELQLWMRGFPVMRARVGRLLVRISRVQRVADGATKGPYDLLWLLAFKPDELGIDLPGIAALWHMACLHETSRGAAWQMLGYWARNCRDYPELRDTFTELACEFEKVAANSELRSRLKVYRRRWTAYLDEEDDT